MIRGSWLQLTSPGDTPVTLAAVKQHLRVTTSSDDSLITAYINAATTYVETYTRRALVQRQFLLTMDEFPDDIQIVIPVSPLVSVQYVKYVDYNTGVLTTWSSSNYSVDVGSQFGRIVKVLGIIWPIIKLQTPNAAQITFTAGYSTDNANVPPCLQIAIMYLVTQMYTNRSPVEVGAGNVLEVPLTLQALMDPYKLFAQ